MDRAVVKWYVGLWLVVMTLPTVLRADDASDQYAVAAGHYGAARWQLACEEFETFLKNYPSHEKSSVARFYLAESLAQSGKHGPAVKLFDELLSVNADAPFARQVRFRQAESLFLAGDDEQARKTLESFRQRYANDELLAYVLPYLGELRLRASEASEALKLYETAATQFPKGPMVGECQFGIARALEQLGETEKARHSYQAIADDAYAPLADRAQLQLGALQNGSGQYSPALSSFDSFLQRFPKSALLPQARLGRGWSLFKLEKYDDAEIAFKSLFEDPDFAIEAKYWTGMMHVGRQQWQQAATTLNDALSSATRHRLQTAIVFQLGESLRHLGQLEQATAQFQRILSEHPEDNYADDALFASLQLALQQENHQQAVDLAQDFLKRFPESTLGVAAECNSTLAICLAQLGQFADAKATLTELKQSNPQSDLLAATTYKVAEAAYTAGDQVTAKELFGELSKSSSSDEWTSRGLAGLAWSQLKDDDIAGSAKTFEKLVEDHSDDPLAATAALVRGQSLEELGQSESALAMYRQVIQKFPDSPERPQALLRAALLCDKLHQPDEARALYRDLAALKHACPEQVAALFQWGCLEADAGNSEEAAKLWKQVRVEHSDSPLAIDAHYRLAAAAFELERYTDCDELLRALDTKTNTEHLTVHILYLRGRLKVALQQWNEVGSPLEELIRRFPKHELACASAYWIAEAAYQRGEHSAAIDQFARLQQSTTVTPWTALSRLRQAQSLIQLQRWEDSLALARTIETDFPDFPSQHEVDYVIGRCLANDADFEGAREAYTKVTKSRLGGKTETAAMAQWMIGESYFHQEEFSLALKAYLRVEILYDFPRWQAAALLQAGKCQEQLGEWSNAIELYSKLLQNYPKSDVAGEATKRLGVAQNRLETRKS